jgi:hypothetical protein
VVSGIISPAVSGIIDYLREYEAICKKALTRVSMAQMELFGEKTGGRKSRDRVPLNTGMRKGPSQIFKRF